jgi:hypothetical protein
MFTTIFDVAADGEELRFFVVFEVLVFFETTRLEELQLAKNALKIRMRMIFFMYAYI